MAQNEWDPALYNQKHSYVYDYGRELVSVLAPQPGEMILDLGCGTGHLAATIAEWGAHVVGLDSSKQMISAARADFPQLEFLLSLTPETSLCLIRSTPSCQTPPCTGYRRLNQ